MGYNDDTNARLIDAKVLLDKVLWLEDSTYGSLAAVDVEKVDIKAAWDILDGIIYANKISYEFQTEVSREHDVEHWTEIDAALKSARDRLDGIDDEWFWSERGGAMEEVMDVFANRCGINY